MRFTVMTVLASAYMCRTRFAMVRIKWKEKEFDVIKLCPKSICDANYSFLSLCCCYCFASIENSLELCCGVEYTSCVVLDE